MIDHTLAFKLIISLACVAAWWITSRVEPRMAPGVRRWFPATVWLVTRPLLFIVTFVVLGLPAQSDVPFFYYPQGHHALAGGLTYRDFSSSYGPLFPYLCAIPIVIWDSAKSIIFLSILCEIATILVWRTFALRTTNRDEARDALWLYLWNPVPILVTSISGQNQTWIAALWGLSALLLLSRPLLAGVSAAASVICVKFLGVLAVPVFFLGAASRWRFIAGFALPCVAVFAPFMFAGADVLQPVRYEGSLTTSGNIPYLLTVVGLNPLDPSISMLLQLLLLASLAGMWFWLLWQWRAQAGATMLLLALCAVMLVFMLMSKKAYTHYLVIFGPPLCLVMAHITHRPALRLVFMLFSAVAAMEPSMWFRWMSERTLHGAVSGGGKSLTFLGIECLLIGGYLVLLIAILRHIRRGPADAPALSHS